MPKSRVALRHVFRKLSLNAKGSGWAWGLACFFISILWWGCEVQSCKNQLKWPSEPSKVKKFLALQAQVTVASSQVWMIIVAAWKITFSVSDRLRTISETL